MSLPIQRRMVVLGGPLSRGSDAAVTPSIGSKNSAQEVPLSRQDDSARVQASLPDADCTALVINSSQDMAKDITLQIAVDMPGCSMIYAPTLQIARVILKRRKIDLVVSAPVLPDGSFLSLKDELETLSPPPDVIVVGDLSMKAAESLSRSRYQVSTVRRMHALRKENSGIQIRRRHNPIRELGADIRNDLNNPLQEIVAMVFVARAGGEASPVAETALQAINKAAQNMAKVVNGLEQKISSVVNGKP